MKRLQIFVISIFFTVSFGLYNSNSASGKISSPTALLDFLHES